MAFSFETVYEFLAQNLIKVGLDDEMFVPMLANVCCDDDGNVIDVRWMPDEMITPFFANASGKIRLGKFLRSALIHIGDNPFCMVVISEAYFAQREFTEAEIERAKHESLADDPNAKECIMISIYRPNEMRMGTLEILPGRELKYAPLLPMGKFQGSMTLEPDVNFKE